MSKLELPVRVYEAVDVMRAKNHWFKLCFPLESVLGAPSMEIEFSAGAFTLRWEEVDFHSEMRRRKATGKTLVDAVEAANATPEDPTDGR